MTAADFALAERRSLRGYDAVQLAAALELRDGGAAVEFACFDARLVRAARSERLARAAHSERPAVGVR